MEIILTVSGKAQFKHWRSDLAWAKILYRERNDKVIFLRLWKQCSMKNGRWYQPWFNKKEIERFKRYARRRLEQLNNQYCDYNNGSEEEEDNRIIRKRQHVSEFCERCIELNHSCYVK